MGLYDATTGTRLTKSGFPKTPYTDPDPKFVVTAGVTRREPFPGAEDGTVEGSKKTQAFGVGDIISQSQLDALFPAATIDTITPATGTTVGGTVVTIKGDNLDGVTSVTFGGTAGTSLTQVDADTIRVTTPAKTAGAYNVAVVDDSGTTTKTNGYTYS